MVQVLENEPYDTKCDVYSFGICLWEIYCCDMPYPHLRLSDLTSSVVYQVYIINFLLPYLPLMTDHTYLLYTLKLTKADEFLFFLCLKLCTEYEATDTQVLPKLSGTSYRSVLGSRPQQKTRDERGGNHVRSH